MRAAAPSTAEGVERGLLLRLARQQGSRSVFAIARSCLRAVFLMCSFCQQPVSLSPSRPACFLVSLRDASSTNFLGSALQLLAPVRL